MAIEIKSLCLLLALTLSSGCLAPQGLVYTHVTKPYTLPQESVARVGSKKCSIDLTQLKEPITRANLSVLWTSRAVADATHRAGMTEIRYADLDTLSILNGVYARRRLIFYGD